MLTLIEETTLTEKDKASLVSYLNTLFDEGMNILESSKEWPVLKKKGNVIIRQLKEKGQPNYLQRTSQHDDVSYSQFYDILCINHSINEPKYVDTLEEAKEYQLLLKNEDGDDHHHINAGIYWLGYKASIVSPREFIELVISRNNNNNNNTSPPSLSTNNDQQKELRSFIVISKPIQTSPLLKYHRKGYVLGKYLAYELVQEKWDDQNKKKYIEWITISQSSPGGYIPKFISDWVTVKGLYDDVDGLINYIKYKYN
ncbi:unnamed protein product [Cunninghamella blakesleeana]